MAKMIIHLADGAQLEASEDACRALDRSGCVHHDADGNWVALADDLKLVAPPSPEAQLLAKTKTADYFEPDMAPEVLALRVNDFWGLLRSRAKEIAPDFPFGERPTAWDLLWAIMSSALGTADANRDLHKLLNEFSLAKAVEAQPPQLADGFYWGRSPGGTHWTLFLVEGRHVSRFSETNGWQVVLGPLPELRGPILDPAQLAARVLSHGEELFKSRYGEQPLEPKDESWVRLSTYQFRKLEDGEQLILVFSHGVGHVRGDVTPRRLIESADAAFQADDTGFVQCIKYRNHRALRAIHAACRFVLSKVEGAATADV
jgi:hypothetical protein